MIAKHAWCVILANFNMLEPYFSGNAILNDIWEVELVSMLWQIKRVPLPLRNNMNCDQQPHNDLILTFKYKVPYISVTVYLPSPSFNDWCTQTAKPIKNQGSPPCVKYPRSSLWHLFCEPEPPVITFIFCSSRAVSFTLTVLFTLVILTAYMVYTNLSLVFKWLLNLSEFV